MDLTSKVPSGRPLLFQCRDSVGRVKGGLRPSPAAISLRFTLDSAHGITGEKRAGGRERWGPQVGVRAGGFGGGPGPSGAIASRLHAGMV